MQKNQLLAVVIAIVLLVGLYFLGAQKGNSKKPEMAGGANRDAAKPPMEMMGNTAEPIDIEHYIDDNIKKLAIDKKTVLDALISKNKSASTAITNKDLAEFWEKQKDITAAAYYYKKAAFLENTEKSITFAGNLYLALIGKTEDASTRKWQSLEAIECFDTLIHRNANNIDAKIALATCYTDGTGETMKGVTLLREITAKDSNNIAANIILGKLAIQSGQLPKAEKRFERVLSIQPKNTEAMYFLAETYKNQGQKDKAIALFTKCKSIVKDPAFAQEIDKYISSFK
jgi:tetratricopeptide (TPR) repeat protein